jgi:aminoglycoside phosphotransferase (APT) family kinase protein
VEGTTHVNRGMKSEWLSALVIELLNKYVPYDADEATWGRLEYPRKSWLEFNETSIEEARVNIGDVLSDQDYIFTKSIVDTLFRKQSAASERFLLHGDNGVHNFVYRDDRLVGVIDPSPMAGPILYDFVYAFCSSPDDLDLETLFAAYDHLHRKSVDKSRLIQETAVQLYCRIGLSKKHHPGDLPEYLKAWESWKDYCLGGI